MKRFLIGAPASGKSTIGRIIAESSDYCHTSIDSFVHLVYSYSTVNRPMLDSEIDEALHKLLLFSDEKLIYEFSYHDYNKLLERPYLLFGERDRVVIVTAPLEICLQRNKCRANTIPENYLVRCWHSTNQVFERFLDLSLCNFIVVNTSFESKNACALIARNFFDA